MSQGHHTRETIQRSIEHLRKISVVLKAPSNTSVVMNGLVNRIALVI